MTIANVPARPRAATMRAVTTARGGAGQSASAATMRAVTTARGGAGQSASAATMRAVTRARRWGRNPRRAAARGEPGYLLANLQWRAHCRPVRGTVDRTAREGGYRQCGA